MAPSRETQRTLKDQDDGVRDALPPEAHILVVDDDAEIRRLLAGFLREQGYRVTTASDGRELLEKVRAASIDLVILDVMLPGANGFELCRNIRATSSTPVIMLTAKGADTDRIVGLEMGADDYVSKPFNPRELVARVKAILRRSQAASGTVRPAGGQRFLFDGWVLDALRRELRDPSGVLIDLSTGEYDLLLTFVEAPQRVLSREQLLDLSRNRTSTGFDRSIDVQVSRLRRKLDVSDEAESFIKTVRGAGYMFLPSVTRL